MQCPCGAPHSQFAQMLWLVCKESTNKQLAIIEKMRQCSVATYLGCLTAVNWIFLNPEWYNSTRHKMTPARQISCQKVKSQFAGKVKSHNSIIASKHIVIKSMGWCFVWNQNTCAAQWRCHFPSECRCQFMLSKIDIWLAPAWISHQQKKGNMPPYESNP